MRTLTLMAVFAAGMATSQLLPQSQAWQETKPKAPEWKASSVVAVRKAGENEGGAQTKRVGIEVFKDEATNVWLFVSETGDIAVAPAR